MSFTILKFETRYKGDKATDWVLLAPIGEAFDRTRTWHAVHTLKPNPKVEGEMAVIMKARWQAIEPAYEAWKAGEELPEGGTPLGAWGGVTQTQADFLRSIGIKTVEAVADMSDSAIDRVPFPGRRELPKMAKEYLSSKDATDLAAQNAELRERMAAMEEMLAEAMADKAEQKPAKRKEQAA